MEVEVTADPKLVLIKMVVLNLMNICLSLACYKLDRLWPRTLITAIYFISFLLFAQFVSNGQYDFPTWGRLLKVFCVLPLGLGVILMYKSLPNKTQQRYLKEVTAYINTAVVVNILMMAFIPYDETYRSITSRITCIFLSVWLLKEMHRMEWKTCEFENGLFLFKASPLLWVYCHAMYRIVLVSLPIFETLSYVLVEPASLGIMYLLAAGQQSGDPASNNNNNTQKKPVGFFFGFSDTIVIASFSLGSSLFFDDPISLQLNMIPQHLLDLALIPVHLMIIAVALAHIISL